MRPSRNHLLAVRRSNAIGTEDQTERIHPPTGPHWSRSLFARALPTCCLGDVAGIFFAASGRRFGHRRRATGQIVFERAFPENGDMHVAGKARDLGAADRLLRVYSRTTVASADRR